MYRVFLLIVPMTLALVGCPSSSPADASMTDARRALPRAMCGAACMDGASFVPSASYDPATSCYDGCNWCTCFSEGLGNCTARLCSDAGMK